MHIAHMHTVFAILAASSRGVLGTFLGRSPLDSREYASTRAMKTTHQTTRPASSMWLDWSTPTSPADLSPTTYRAQKYSATRLRTEMARIAHFAFFAYATPSASRPIPSRSGKSNQRLVSSSGSPWTELYPFEYQSGNLPIVRIMKSGLDSEAFPDRLPRGATPPSRSCTCPKRTPRPGPAPPRLQPAP